MEQRRARPWSLGFALLGVAYACSDDAAVTSRPTGLTGGDAGKGTAATGGSSASGGSGGTASGTGGTIEVGKGGGSGKGSKGGTGGSSAGGSSAQGGSDNGGVGNDFGFGGLPDVTFDYDPESGGEGGACASEVGEATLRKRPMDVIVSIDNSKSMEGEIKEVQARINVNFANILNLSGIDYRVILVSRYGNVYTENFDGGRAQDSAYSVCIGAPLSTLTCPANGTDVTPAVANNAGKFYHHSTEIGSNNMWCRLLGSYEASDPYPRARAGFVPVAPTGWKSFLRAGSLKVFVGITDDSPTTDGTLGCPDILSGNDEQAWATSFDGALRTLDPAQFETAAGERNYVWYGIVGMAGNAIANPTPLTPADPVELNCCKGDGTVQTNCGGNTAPATDGAHNGAGYQYLSILTGGLRYPSCYNSNFDDIFNKIAEGVIEGAQASCVYDVPEPDHGIVDFDQTKVSYRPGGSGSVPLNRRASDVDCGAGEGFYFSTDNTKINLCPATCTTVQADPDAKVAIDFGCLGS